MAHSQLQVLDWENENVPVKNISIVTEDENSVVNVVPDCRNCLHVFPNDLLF